jgi:hypothetical protein
MFPFDRPFEASSHPLFICTERIATFVGRTLGSNRPNVVRMHSAFAVNGMGVRENEIRAA